MDITKTIVNKKGLVFNYVIDSEFEGFWIKHTYHLHPYNYGQSYYICRSGNKEIDGKTTVPLHQDVIKFYGYEIPEGMVVDHKNINQFDNTRRNLRVTTYSQNNLNKRNSVIRKGHLPGWNYCKAKYGYQIQTSNLGVTKYQGRTKFEEKASIWCCTGVKPY